MVLLLLKRKRNWTDKKQDFQKILNRLNPTTFTEIPEAGEDLSIGT